MKIPIGKMANMKTVKMLTRLMPLIFLEKTNTQNTTYE